MAEPYFQFRQFRVQHHRDVLKVGTDGVLLGAWAEVNDGESVLDIGTGSGLIAMMVAQRARVRIDAIDIAQGAAAMAAHNFARAPFADIRAFQSDLTAWHQGLKERYDLLVCNPPFFTHAQPPKNAALHLAKHTVALTPAVLFREAARLLRPSGRLSLIIPTQGHEEFFREAMRNDFHLVRQTSVLPLPHRPSKRLLVTFTPVAPEQVQEDELVIENEAGQRGYTDAYRRLTADYFLRW